MTRSRWLAFALGAALLLVGAHLLDRWAYAGLAYPPGNDRDWGRMLRIVGFAPSWGILALALYLESRATPGWNRQCDAALGIVIAVAAGGLLGEAIKLVVRRNRPDATLAYTFRPFADHPWSTRDFGMPSSHAMVAFAGATALSRRYPRAAPVLFALAAGCGLTRLMAQAHFLSDVVAGAIGGTAVALAPRLRAGSGPRPARAD